MAELHLRLRPRPGDRALVSGCVEVLVGEVERPAARRRNHRPKRDAHRGAGQNPHAVAEAEDRIEHGAHRIGERLAISHANWRPDPPPAPDEARPVRLELDIAHGVAFHRGEMRRPDFRLAGRPPAPRG